MANVKDITVPLAEKVIPWLKDTLQDPELPKFEADDYTVNSLLSIMERTKQIDQATTYICQDSIEKRREYEAEEQRLSTLHSAIGVTLDRLSHSGSTSISLLTKAAVALGIKDCSLSNYMLAMSDLQREHFGVQQLLEESQLASSVLAQRKLIAETDNKHLHSLEENLARHEAMDSSVSEKRLKETNYLKQKLGEYNSDIAKLENELQNAGWNSQLQHESLIALSDTIDALEAELAPLKKKLSAYQSLPPDLSLAKIKVEERKLELIFLMPHRGLREVNDKMELI